MRRSLFLAATIVLAAASPALAHTGAGPVSGFMSGFGHPLGGLDHMLAMLAVGILAFQMGGKSVWLVPASFVAMMLVGGVLGMSQIALPFVELGIVGSVIILGAVIALGKEMPVIPAMVLVGAFAIFHGHAHGAEMPANMNAIEYGVGFGEATMLLHALGIALSMGVKKVAEKTAPAALRLGGGAIATAGILLFFV